MKKAKQKFGVRAVGPSSGSYLFSGSKTECLRFMAYALAQDPDQPLMIELHGKFSR